MRKDILEKVNRFYKERLAFYRQLNMDALDKARKDENISSIERRINEIKILAVSGKLTDDIDKEYNELVARYKELVRPYLPDIKYECPICKDKGVVGNKYCKCFMNRYTNELRKKANISSLPKFTFDDNTLDSFAIDDATKTKYSKVYSKLESFANNYPNVDKINIFLKGQSGSGKTCLVSAIANRLIDKGEMVQYITSFDLGEMMLASHLNIKDNSLSIITNADVLIIDDLGSEPIRNNINQTYLQSILDSRIVHRKATIVTTNLNAEQLMKKYGERIISRLLNKTDTIAIDFGVTPNLRTTKKD